MLPKRKSKTISVDSGTYRYVVSESQSDNTSVALAVTIQNEGNGAILRVTGLTTFRLPVMESRLYRGRTLADPILPRHVKFLIARGIDNGWRPNESCSRVNMHVANADVFDSVA